MWVGGAEGDRTLDLRIANAALSQLSYCPTRWTGRIIRHLGRVCQAARIAPNFVPETAATVPKASACKGFVHGGNESGRIADGAGLMPPLCDPGVASYDEHQQREIRLPRRLVQLIITKLKPLLLSNTKECEINGLLAPQTLLVSGGLLCEASSGVVYDHS